MMKCITSAATLVILMLFQFVFANEMATLEAERSDNFLSMRKRDLATTSSPTRAPTTLSPNTFKPSTSNPSQRTTVKPTPRTTTKRPSQNPSQRNTSIKPTHNPAPKASSKPTRKPTPKNAPTKPTAAPISPIKSTKVATGEWVTGFAFLPDNNTLVFAERFSGMIFIHDIAKNITMPTAQINGIDADPESNDGLLGVAIDPDWNNNPYIYVYVTRSAKGKSVDQIIKITSTVTFPSLTGKQQSIWSMKRLPNAMNDGGRILFGPDGYLYALTGDTDRSEMAQNLNVDAGKVLRMTNTGGIPNKNPFKNSLVYAYGIRNSIGAAFDPTTGYLWAGDNGPTCNDEINLILAGANYGWGPQSECPNTNAAGKNIQLPKLLFNGAPNAITGLTFAGKNNDMFVAHLVPSAIRRLSFNESRSDIRTDLGIIYNLPLEQGLLLALETDRNGTMFYSTATGIYKLSIE